jgi:hypothetical protein
LNPPVSPLRKGGLLSLPGPVGVDAIAASPRYEMRSEIVAQPGAPQDLGNDLPARRGKMARWDHQNPRSDLP